ncbi:MAG: 30S ribosomal protein S12 methylthiotransferase RimO, partial [Acidobacteriota bacterium]
VGEVLDVLIEGRPSAGSRSLAARARFQAPEVDGRVLVSLPRGGARMFPSPLAKAEIYSAGAYDLKGRLVS